MGRIPDPPRRIPQGCQTVGANSLNPCKHLPGVSLKTSKRLPVIFGKLNTMHVQGLAPKRWTSFIAFRVNHREREVDDRERIFFVAFEIQYNNLGLRKTK